MLDTVTNLKSLLDDPTLLCEKAYIAGKWVNGDNGRFQVTNPARGDVIAKRCRPHARASGRCHCQSRERTKGVGHLDR